jgi:hypothetical protein
MDSHNLFFTRATAYWLRAEYALALVVGVVLAVLHLGEIRWLPFIGLFVHIDLIGYLPGAVAFRRAPDGRIPLVYYRLYNVMHSHLSAALVAGVWCLVVGPEWALLALPIHQCGDRALFGNFQKPYGLSFEPATHPAYQELVNRYDQPDPARPTDRAVVRTAA